MISGVGTAWADEEPFYTLDGTITTGGNSNYAQDGGGLTQEGISWSVTGNTTTSPWRIGGKNLTDVNRDVYSKTAMGAAISKIELEIGSITLSNVNSIKLIVASNSDFSTEIETIEKTSITANTTLTFEPSGSEWAKDAYYKFVFNVDAGSSNSYIQLKSIKFFEATASASPLASIALSGTYPTNFYVGDAFSHEGMTVTATYEDASTNDVTNSAIFSGYDMDNAGSQTVTVSYTENDITKKAQYGITVSERPKFTVTFSDGGSVTEESAGAGVTLPSREAIGDYTFAGWSETDVAVETTVAPTIIPAGSYNPTANVTLYPVYTRTEGGGAVVDEWVEIFEVPTDGYYAICSDSYFMKAVIDSKRFANGDKSPNIEDGKLIDAPADDCIWNIYKADSYYRIKYENSFASATGSNNQGKFVTDESDNYAKWTITYSNGFVIENVGMASANKNKTLRNNGTYGWASYGATTGDAPRLFKKISQASSTTYYFSSPVAAAVERPVINFAENPFLFSTTATITCATEGATIKYSFDGENWNDYSEALTITATTTIYAKATKGNDESKIATATVTKNLAEPTVAISGDLTVDLNGETNVEAGTLTAAVTYNETAVDGATVTWSGDNDDVATINAETGAVTIKSRGTVTFTATYAGNNDYTEATATKEITVIDSKAPGTQGRPYTVAEAIDAIDNDGDVNGVYVKGVISQIDSYNSNYKSITYWISEDGTTENQFEVYSGKGLNGADFSSKEDLQLGDVVVVYGNITYYSKNSVYEFSANNQLVSLTRKAEAGLSFEKEAYEVRLGNDFDEPALVNPNNLSPITWESSNEAVATVDSEGAVTVKAVGTTTITATFAGNEDYKAGEASYELTVTNDKLDAGLELVDASISMNAATEKDITTLFTVTSDGAVTYKSNDEEVAKVSEGKLVAVAPGETTITINVAEADDYKAATVDLPVTVTVYADVAAFDPNAKGGYVLVTDASTLQAGDNLILVNSNEDGGAYAMGAQNTNNRGQVEVSIKEGIITDINEAQEIILEGVAGAWYLNVGEDSYLYAASNSSNYLRSANLETVGDNGKAAININGSASIVFQGTNSRNNLRYNATSSLFSCYASTSEMDEPYIYRYQSADVTIGSTGWRTLVASANVKFPEGVTAYIVTSEDSEKAKLKAVKAVKANVPVLLKAEPGNYILTVAADGDCADTSKNLLEVSEQNTCENVYVLANKSNGVGFYQWTGGWMGAGRVYLPVGPEVGARGFLAFDEDGETTGISTIQNAKQGTKEIYNLNGQRVNQPAKGLYIVNGKKVFIK